MSQLDSGIFLTHPKYMLYILKDSGLLCYKPSKVPIEKNIDFRNDNTEKLPDPLSFRKLLGKLMYLNITIPDIGYAIQTLS